MQIDRLRHFLVVAEEQNISKAAEKLYISQPALSRQISSLEKDVGFSLFNRKKNRLSLTPQGTAFATECEKLVSQYDTLIYHFQDGNINAAPLTIGFHGSSLFRILSKIMKLIENDKAHIPLQFVTGIFSTLMIALYDDTIDMAIVPLDCVPKLTGIRSIKLMDNHLGVLLPKNHVLAERTTVSVAELAKEDFIMSNRDFAFAQNGLQDYFRKNGYELNVSYYENDTYIRVYCGSWQARGSVLCLRFSQNNILMISPL